MALRLAATSRWTKSFTSRVCPLGWVIGLGVYVNSVQAATFAACLLESGAVAVVLASICCWAGAGPLRSIPAAWRRAGSTNAITHRIANGDLTAEIPSDVDSNSVAHGIRSMRQVARIVLDVRRGSGSGHRQQRTPRAPRPVGAHRKPGEQALQQTASMRSSWVHRAPQRRQRAAGQPAGGWRCAWHPRLVVEGQQLMQGISASSHKIADTIGGSTAQVSDQHPSIQRRRSCARWRAGLSVAGEVRSLPGAAPMPPKKSRNYHRQRQRVEHAAGDKAGVNTQPEEVVASIRRVTDIMARSGAPPVSEQSSGVSQAGSSADGPGHAAKRRPGRRMHAAASSPQRQ